MTRASHGGSCSAWLARIVIVGTLTVMAPAAGWSAEAPDLIGADGGAPDVMVVGVVVPARGKPFAAIQDRATMKTRFYRVGDSVNGGVVTVIKPDRVTIAFGNEVMLVRLAGAVDDSSEVRTQRAGDPRLNPRPVVTMARRVEDVSSPYGQMGAIIPTFPASPASRKDRDETGERATGGGASAGGGGGAPAASFGVGPNTAAVQFTGQLQSGGELPGEQFSAQSLRDLLISVTHTNLTASRQRIELTTPEGGVYQKFSGDATPASQLRVPIGGTWITEHNLYGSWTVRVFLDRQSVPVASGVFVLDQ